MTTLDLGPNVFVTPRGDRHTTIGQLATQHELDYHGTRTDIAEFARSALDGLRRVFHAHKRPLPANVIPDAEWTEDEDW